jgi:hypothetical protein
VLSKLSTPSPDSCRNPCQPARRTAAAHGPWFHARWPALPVTAAFLLGLAIVGSVGNLAALQRLVRIHRRVHATR